MKNILIAISALFVAGSVHAGIPLLNYTCPGNIEVHADQGGPVYINGKETKLKKFSDTYYEAKGTGVTVEIMINPDETLSVSYTGPHRAHGICQPSDTCGIAGSACAQAGHSGKSIPETSVPCSHSWYRLIEERVPTGDGQGHGPDIGSDEWKSVIEFKLGIRDKPNLPSRDSEAWCRHIDQIVRESGTSSRSGEEVGGAAMTQSPSYACDKVRAGSIEAMICEDKELSALDRKLSGVYAAASKKATNEHPPVLKAEQRGWIKGRNDCWKSDDKHACVRDEYIRRIAELQAKYRLVPGNGPVRFLCDGNPANEVVATFFQPTPQP